MKNLSDPIDAITQDFVDLFGHLSQEQLNWKPNPETWSIAQNLDHLMVINESYYPVVDSLRKGTYALPFLARFGFIVSFFGNMILKSVSPDRKRKIKTFPIWEPSKSEIAPGILDRFITHQNQLKAFMSEASDLVEKGTVISSPANKNIVYKLEKAFEIILTHEQRHLEQAKEVLHQFPSSRVIQ